MTPVLGHDMTAGTQGPVAFANPNMASTGIHTGMNGGMAGIDISGIGRLGQQPGQVFHLQPFHETSGNPSFGQALTNTIGQINDVMQKPNALLQDAVVNGSADIHDVMIANAKAELAINLTTQVATKVIQAYDRIIQMQV